MRAGFALWALALALTGGALVAGRALPPAPWLTYTREALTGIGDIFLHDVERGLAFNLTRTPHRRESHAVWSPDGTRLAFECGTPAAGSDDICLAGVDLAPTPARFQPGSWLSRPRWSPDGTQIAYVARDGSAQSGYMIYTVELATGTRRAVGAVDSARTFSWSPDGTQIAFTAFADQRMRVYTAAVADGALTEPEQASTSNYGAAWSPDGVGIAFVSSTQGYKQRLYLLNPAGGVRPLTDGGGIGNDFAPVWSPDGTRLAFLSDRDGADYDLFILDGEGVQQVTANYYLDEHAAWSPDGRSIALMSNRDGGFHIYVVSVEDGTTRRITSGSALHNHPAWRRSG